MTEQIDNEVSKLREELRIGNILTAKLTDQCREFELRLIECVTPDEVREALEQAREDGLDDGFERGKAFAKHIDKRYTEIVEQAKQEVARWVDETFADSVTKGEMLATNTWQEYFKNEH